MSSEDLNEFFNPDEVKAVVVAAMGEHVLPFVTAISVNRGVRRSRRSFLVRKVFCFQRWVFKSHLIEVIKVTDPQKPNRIDEGGPPTSARYRRASDRQPLEVVTCTLFRPLNDLTINGQRSGWQHTPERTHGGDGTPARGCLKTFFLQPRYEVKIVMT